MNKLNPNNVVRADLVIGIPSHNNAQTITSVVTQAVEALKTYFPDFISVLINVDNNSPDNTKGAFMNASSSVPKIYVSTPPGIKGKGYNLHNLFQEMVSLNARAGVIVEANMANLTPEWIKELASPVLCGYDYVAPLYPLGDYEGPIANNVCYPLIYGLLGKDIRQPLGGDFAFSLDLAKYYLKQQWIEATHQHGIDIFMTSHALLGDFECSQVALGPKARQPDWKKHGEIFTQVIETLFHTLLSNKEKWLNPVDVTKYPLFGEQLVHTHSMPGLNVQTLKEPALVEFREHQQLLAGVVDPFSYGDLLQMFSAGDWNIGTDMWMRIVYDLLFSYDNGGSQIDLVRAMQPLYYGRALSFAKQAADKDHLEAETLIRQQAHHFYGNRDSLTHKYGYKQAVA